LVLPGAAYFAWRWSYYGQFLPNTFYVKAGHSPSLESVLSFGHFLSLYLMLPALFVVLTGALTGRREFARLRALVWRPVEWSARSVVVACFTGFVFVVLAQYLSSSLIMNVSHRFFVPFHPIFLVALALLAQASTEAPETAHELHSVRSTQIRWGASGLVLVAFAALMFQQLHKELDYTREYLLLIEEQHLPAGTFLREAVPADEWLIVHIDAGAIPYASGLRTVDFGGLNDEVLSHGLSAREQVEYFYSRDAGALVFSSYSWDRLDRPSADLIYQDPRFENYVLVRKCRSRGELSKNYHEFVYLRRDLIRDESQTP